MFFQVATKEESSEPEVESADDDVTTEENITQENGNLFKQVTSLK